jgi:hypothetical protein
MDIGPTELIIVCCIGILLLAIAGVFLLVISRILRK